jgi:Fis family transcriptional regulator
VASKKSIKRERVTKKVTAKKSSSKADKKAEKKTDKKSEVQVQSRNRLLRNFTEDALKSYFKNLNGHKPADIYKLVMGEVEPPLLQSVLEYTQGNQSVAADILGLSRATLRKKLKHYKLHS